MRISLVEVHDENSFSMKRFYRDVLNSLLKSHFDVNVIKSKRYNFVRRTGFPKKLVYYFESWLFAAVRIALKTRRNDILFFTDTSDAGVVNLLIIGIVKMKRLKVVTTTHDLYGVIAAKGDLSQVRLSRSGKVLQHLIAFGLRFADLNLAISNEAFRHSEKIIPRVRTEIIPIPIRVEFHNESIALTSLPENYATLIMQADWRKDRFSSIALWVKIHSIQNNLWLVIVGSPLTETEKKLIQGHEHSVIHLNNLTNDLLYQVYFQSNFNIFLSKYEGFGYPILEANYFSKPSILYNTTHFRDIGGSGNLYIEDLETTNVDSILEQLQRVNQLSLSARVKNSFSLDLLSSRLLELLKDLQDNE